MCEQQITPEMQKALDLIKELPLDDGKPSKLQELCNKYLWPAEKEVAIPAIFSFEGGEFVIIKGKSSEDSYLISGHDIKTAKPIGGLQGVNFKLEINEPPRLEYKRIRVDELYGNQVFLDSEGRLVYDTYIFTNPSIIVIDPEVSTDVYASFIEASVTRKFIEEAN